MQNTLHLVLRDLRKEHGKTQKEIADAINITDRTYGHYEAEFQTVHSINMTITHILL